MLYVGTQLASSLLMSTPTMNYTQHQIMLLMPLFFLILIVQFPAGLIVYWITTNAWTMLQQFVIRRRIGPRRRHRRAGRQRPLPGAERPPMGEWPTTPALRD